MNEASLKLLNSAIRSLAESSSVELIADGLRAQVSHRRSPYRSHRTVQYCEVGQRRWSAYNGKYYLILADLQDLPEIPVCSAYHPNHRIVWEVFDIPAAMLEPLFDEWTRWTGVKPYRPPLVRCAIPIPRLTGFVAGLPMFEFKHAPWMQNEIIRFYGWRAYRAGGETPEDWPSFLPPANLPGITIRTNGQTSGNSVEPAHGWFDHRPWWLVSVGSPDVDVVAVETGSANGLPEGRWWVTIN